MTGSTSRFTSAVSTDPLTPGLVEDESGHVWVVAPGGKRYRLDAALRALAGDDGDSGQVVNSAPFAGAPAGELRSQTIGPMPKDATIDYVAYLPLGDVSLQDAPYQGRGWRLVRVGDNATIFDSVYHFTNRPFEDQEQMPRDYLYGLYPNEDVRKSLKAGDIIRFDSYQASFYLRQPQDPPDPPIAYLFDSSTTAGAPAVGRLRLNNADRALVTEIYVNNTDGFEVDYGAFLDAMDEAAGFKGHLRLYERNRNDYVIYEVTAVVASSSTHKTISVTHVFTGGGTLSNNDPVAFEFSTERLYVADLAAPLDPGGILTIAYTPLNPTPTSVPVVRFDGLVNDGPGDEGGELDPLFDTRPDGVTFGIGRIGTDPYMVDPGGGGGGGGAAKFCFEWFGLKWGKDYEAVYNWAEFKRMLLERGQDPERWACDHPQWSSCLNHASTCGNPDPPLPLGLSVLAGSPIAKRVEPVFFVAAAASVVAVTAAPFFADVFQQISHGGAPIAFKFDRIYNPGKDFTLPEWTHSPEIDFDGDGIPDQVPFQHTVKVVAYNGQVASSIHTVGRSLARIRARKAAATLCGELVIIPPRESIEWGYEPDAIPPDYIVTSATFLSLIPGGTIVKAEMGIVMRNALGIVCAIKTFEWGQQPPYRRALTGILGKKATRVLGPHEQHWTSTVNFEADIRLPNGSLTFCEFHNRSSLGDFLLTVLAHTNRYINNGRQGNLATEWSKAMPGGVSG